MTLDTGHFTSANVDPAQVARTFAGRIFHVHIKDHIGTESVALGEGDTDNFAVVRELKAAGYDGYLSQEIELEDGSKADHAAHVGYAGEIREFGEAILEKREPYCGTDDTVKALRVIEAVAAKPNGTSRLD